MASAPANESLGDSVKKLVRSLLLTEKNGLSFRQLQDYYSEFVNGDIPFQTLGFSSLESYLKSIPDAAKVVREPSGQVICYGVADQSTKHIQSLVHRTKSRKKKSTKIPRRSQRQAPPPVAKGAQWKRPQQKNGYRRPPSQSSQQPPPARKPLTNLNENGSTVKPPRGRGSGRGQKIAQDVPPRFRKKSTEDQYSNAPKVIESETSAASSEEVAISRICELLDNSPNGIYLTGLPEVYQKKYKEKVSLDLVDKMAALDICVKERILDDHYILYKKLVITAPRNRFAQRQIKSPKVMSAPTSLPALTIPDEDSLEVRVTLIYDTSLFYCYICGEEYSTKLTELEEKMMEFYSDPETLKLEGEPLVGHYYAAKSGSDWLRAKVEDIYDGVALCRFADHGDKEEVEFANFRNLPNRFCMLPEQSIACCLDKISDLEIPWSGMKRFLLFALGNTLVAKACSRDDPMRVVLYSDNRCINDELLALVTLGKHGMQNSPDGQ